MLLKRRGILRAPFIVFTILGISIVSMIIFPTINFILNYIYREKYPSAVLFLAVIALVHCMIYFMSVSFLPNEAAFLFNLLLGILLQFGLLFVLWIQMRVILSAVTYSFPLDLYEIFSAFGGHANWAIGLAHLINIFLLVVTLLLYLVLMVQASEIILSTKRDAIAAAVAGASEKISKSADGSSEDESITQVDFTYSESSPSVIRGLSREIENDEVFILPLEMRKSEPSDIESMTGYSADSIVTGNYAI